MPVPLKRRRLSRRQLLLRLGLILFWTFDLESLLGRYPGLHIPTPIALVAILAGIVGTVIAIRQEVRTNVEAFRAQRGFCVTCGYDLRGSVNQCPECGRNFKR